MISNVLQVVLSHRVLHALAEPLTNVYVVLFFTRNLCLCIFGDISVLLRDPTFPAKKRKKEKILTVRQGHIKHACKI